MIVAVPPVTTFWLQTGSRFSSPLDRRNPDVQQDRKIIQTLEPVCPKDAVLPAPTLDRICMNTIEQVPNLVRRWMYGANLLDFIRQEANAILGELALESAGNIETTQRNAWDEQIRILKALSIPEGLASQARIYIELSVPRLGRRADVVLLVGHVMFILEFKVGEASFLRSAIDQVWDYALDFKYSKIQREEEGRNIHSECSPLPRRVPNCALKRIVEREVLASAAGEGFRALWNCGFVSGGAPKATCHRCACKDRSCEVVLGRN